MDLSHICKIIGHCHSGVSPAAGQKNGRSNRKRNFTVSYELRGADLAHPSVRSRRRPRTRSRSVWQRVSPAIVFDYEDEHDDEDDLNTLRMVSYGGRPHFDFAIS
jgi:hypothetical protein